jgi:hypothetical protein
MDGDDRVLPVQLAGEHRPGFTGLHVLRVGVEAAIEIGRDVFPVARPADQHAEVVALAAERFGERAVVLEAAAPLEDLLRGRLVLPEVRAGELAFEIAELPRQAGFVKDPSADPRRAR